jgi:hypothetical protein
MKKIDQLTNRDKAKLIFDLFKNEIPTYLEVVQIIADKVVNEKEELQKNWTNHLLSYNEWLYLAQEVKTVLERQGKNLTKSGSVFSYQLFDNFLALFTNHCLEQYSKRKECSPKFAQAVTLFILPD